MVQVQSEFEGLPVIAELEDALDLHQEPWPPLAALLREPVIVEHAMHQSQIRRTARASQCPPHHSVPTVRVAPGIGKHLVRLQFEHLRRTVVAPPEVVPPTDLRL